MLRPGPDPQVQRATLEERRARLAGMFAAGTIDDMTFAAATKAISEELSAVEGHKAADVFDPLAGIPLGAEAGVVARVWADLPVPRKKNIIRRLFTVKVHPVRGTMNPATAHPLLGVEVDDATAVGVAS